ncbi:MAG: MobV family relaxase [Cyanobacteria bacterium P01_A01_bin.116]
MSNTSSYAIARVGTRFKTDGQISACGEHNVRTQETPNADANKSINNECFVGDNNTALTELVWNRIGDNGGKKIRTSADPKHSAVLAFELMLTASPEYFRPDNPGAASEWQADKLQAWETLSAQWLKERYGDNIVRATFHRDESTPHIHAVIVPLNEKGHLNARDYVGGRDRLIALQDSYAEAMKPIGLSRGIRGSKVQHEKIKDYYKSVSQAETLDLSVDELRALAADRQRQVQKRNEFEKTALELSEENFRLKGQLAALQGQISQLQKLVDRSHEFRVISLPEVALKLGMQPSDFDSNRWYSEQHSIRIEGAQFSFVGAGDKGYGAIDLVMRVKVCSFQESLVWLEHQLGTGAARAAAIEQVDAAITEVEATQFRPPVQSVERWPAVRDRLLKQTYLPSPLIDQLHDQRLIYADAQGNAVFIERDTLGEVAGAIKRDTAGQYSRAEKSSESAAFYVVIPDNKLMEKLDRIVITDNPTEALAKLTLEKTAQPTQSIQYQSLGGHRAPSQHAQGVTQVSVALSNSEEGNRAAQDIFKVIPWATIDRLEGSHQAQLKAEMDQLRASMKRSISEIQKTSRTQEKLRKVQDRGLGM